MHKSLGVFLAAGILAMGWAVQVKRPIQEIPPERQADLSRYLQSHWQTPEEYIVSKFRDYAIVFIGEHHHIKHDVELVQNLIPHLYKNGIHDLGIEFGCREYQAKADSLLAAEVYDEGLARWLLFKWGSYWPYKEYEDIYRKAWEFNRTLPPGAPRFRIIHLDYRPGWPLVREGMNPRIWARVFFKGDRDEFMFNVVRDEFIKKNRRALIYTGQFHAFTRFNAPEFNTDTEKMPMLRNDRLGNRVYQAIPERVFLINLHFPWPAKKGPMKYGYPVGGAIDLVMKEFTDKRVGFDVKGSPFAELRDDETLFSVGHKDFTLGDFCDGYVFQKHFADYEGCTVDPQFVTLENFKEAVRYLPNPRLRNVYKTTADFLADMRAKVDFKRKYPDLE